MYSKFNSQYIIRIIRLRFVICMFFLIFILINLIILLNYCLYKFEIEKEVNFIRSSIENDFENYNYLMENLTYFLNNEPSPEEIFKTFNNIVKTKVDKAYVIELYLIKNSEIFTELGKTKVVDIELLELKNQLNIQNNEFFVIELNNVLYLVKHFISKENNLRDSYIILKINYAEVQSTYIVQSGYNLVDQIKFSVNSLKQLQGLDENFIRISMRNLPRDINIVFTFRPKSFFQYLVLKVVPIFLMFLIGLLVMWAAFFSLYKATNVILKIILLRSERAGGRIYNHRLKNGMLEKQNNCLKESMVLRTHFYDKLLLYFSKYTNNQVSIGSGDENKVLVSTIIEESKKILYHELSASGVELSLNLKDNIFLAEEKLFLLQYILLNYVSKAINRSPEGAKVEVKAYSRSENIIIEIVDKGYILEFNKFQTSGRGLLDLNEVALSELSNSIGLQVSRPRVKGGTNKLILVLEDSARLKSTKVERDNDKCNNNVIWFSKKKF